MDYSELANTGTLVQIPEEETHGEAEHQTLRRSERNTLVIDYVRMNAGPQFITEGSSEVSKHIALRHHAVGDITMKAVGYSQNSKHRGIKEAIEIYRRKPILNIQLAAQNQEQRRTTYLHPIYEKIILPPGAET